MRKEGEGGFEGDTERGVKWLVLSFEARFEVGDVIGADGSVAVKVAEGGAVGVAGNVAVVFVTIKSR